MKHRSSEFESLFDNYLIRWNLVPDGQPIRTHSSDLLPVLCGEATGMLKISRHSEERSSGLLMEWWDGQGAARVLARDGSALLLERAMGHRSLAEMARNGQDDEASQIICAVAAKLHALPLPSQPKLVPLSRWFRELESAALRHGGILHQSLDISRELLNSPKENVVLHGDLHHGNILDGGTRGWLAVDPKGLIGEHGFDFANIFCNPDKKTAITPGRLARQATVVAESAHLNRQRLLQWILAYAGLSAAWSLSSPVEKPEPALTVARLAYAELAKA